ncbi:hypothetical protein L9G74_20960, partial [Shewanella sp. C32]
MIVTAPPAPPAAGIHDTDWRSLDMVRVPSFFLYEADPLGGGGGGAIVVELELELDSLHCPGQQQQRQQQQYLWI